MAVVSSFLISCEDNASSLRTITFTFPPGYVQQGTQQWMFISDREGNFLDMEEIRSDAVLSLEIPAHVTSERVMFSILSIYDEGSNYRYRNLITYTDLAPGNYIMTLDRVNASGTGKTKISFTNTDAASTIRLDGDILMQTDLGDAYSCDIVLDENKKASLLAVVASDDQDVRYSFLSLAANDEVTLDYNTMKKADKTVVDLPEGIRHSVIQNVIKNNKQYRLHGSFPESGGNTFSCPVYSSGDFDSYVTSLNITTPTGTESNYWSSSQPFQHFSPLNATATFEQNDETGFILNTTGTADYIIASYYHSTSKNNIDIGDEGTLICPAGSRITVKHVQIPPTLQAAFYADVPPMRTITRVNITESDQIDDYDSFVNYRLVDGKYYFYQYGEGLTRETIISF